MLMWIRALLSTATEIKPLKGREMLAGFISPPVTDTQKEHVLPGMQYV